MSVVAIVGAGMAGLTCARSLRQAGHDVVLFDKARGAGGRLPTRRRDGVAFDHGAPFFRADREIFRQEVDAWRRAGVVEGWIPRRLRIDGAGSKSPLRSESVWVGTPSMSAIGRHLSRDLDLRLSQRVVRLERAGETWNLRDSERTVGAGFDQVVLTVPPDQALELIGNSPELAGQVSISPVAMRPCWCALLAFESPFDPDFDVVFFDHPMLGQAIRDDSKPGRGTEAAWVIHANEAWSRSALEESPERVAAELEAALRGLLPGLPKVVLRDAHRWRYARATGDADASIRSGSRGLWIGGDWRRGPSLEDAFESGLALADEVDAASMPATRGPEES